MASPHKRLIGAAIFLCILGGVGAFIYSKTGLSGQEKEEARYVYELMNSDDVTAHDVKLALARAKAKQKTHTDEVIVSDLESLAYLLHTWDRIGIAVCESELGKSLGVQSKSNHRAIIFDQDRQEYQNALDRASGSGRTACAVEISRYLASPSSHILDNQKSAVGSLRALNTAAITYAATYNAGYPPNLGVLAPPKTGSPNATMSDIRKAANAQAADLIDDVLASGTKSGYRFTYATGKKSGGRTLTYTIHADPLTPGVTGTSHYYTDESGVIRVESENEASSDSLPFVG
jgi:hypothetical protein